MAFSQKIGAGFKKLLGLIFPLFTVKGEHGRWRPWVRWALHIALMLGALIFFAWLNEYLGLDELVVAPWPPLRRCWLPLLFALFYCLGWLAWWLWRLLGPEEVLSSYPDIDRAWSEALQALNKAEIDVGRTPLFLVIGQPASAEESLFQASRLPFKVDQSPRRSDAPLHVYAGPEAIYLICPGVSPLARHATRLALSSATDPGTSGPPGSSESSAATAPLPDIANDLRRLRHLCQQIVSERTPFCAINGIMMLVPAAATVNPDEARNAGDISYYELATVRDALKVHCPLFVLVCDLERIVGCMDLLAGLSEERRNQPIGIGLPLAPDIDPAALPALVEEAVRITCESSVNAFVYQSFRLEGAEEADLDEVLQRNSRLYRLQAELRERIPQICSILSKIVLPEGGGPPLFAGCFLAATGQDAARSQGFVRDLFRKTIEFQNYVSWSGGALAREENYRRWTWMSIFFFIVCSSLLVVMVILSNSRLAD